MKKISQGNKGIQALAKSNPSLVENKFGYDVPGFMYGGMPMSYMGGGDVRYMNEGGMPATPVMTPGSSISSTNINTPDIIPGNPEALDDVMKDFNKFEQSLEQDNFVSFADGGIAMFANGGMMDMFKDDPFKDTGSFNLSSSTALTPILNPETGKYELYGKEYDSFEEAIASSVGDTENVNDNINKNKMIEMGSRLFSLGSGDGMPNTPVMSQGQMISRGGASKVPMGMRMGGITSIQPKFNFEDNFDINDYMENVLGITGRGRGGKGGKGIGDFPELEELTEEEMAERQANAAAARLALGYGSQGGAGGMGRSGYSDTTPGASISIDARDETPDAYRFYPSEVSKLYAQMKGVPFSPLVAPPKEATYIDSLKPRRIQSQLYAADGKFVDRSELITGPGGERGDKIPAMLSDGEFVVNAKAVRGMGVAAGANPQDEYEQRLEGARQMYALQKEGEQMMRKYR